VSERWWKTPCLAERSADELVRIRDIDLLAFHDFVRAYVEPDFQGRIPPELGS
jgi:hypothetical protein